MWQLFEGTARHIVHGDHLTHPFDNQRTPGMPSVTIPVHCHQLGDMIDGQKDGIQLTPQTQLDNLDFADDLTMLSHNQQQMQNKATSLASNSS